MFGKFNLRGDFFNEIVRVTSSAKAFLEVVDVLVEGFSWGVSSQKSKGFALYETFLYFSGRLKSSTFAQSKQICSFDDGDTHTRSIDLVGVESAHSAIEVKDSQMKPETPNASHATSHFWREIQMQTLQARQVDLSRLRRSWSAASRPNEARSARQEVDL